MCLRAESLRELWAFRLEVLMSYHSCWVETDTTVQAVKMILTLKAVISPKNPVSVWYMLGPERGYRIMALGPIYIL